VGRALRTGKLLAAFNPRGSTFDGSLVSVSFGSLRVSFGSLRSLVPPACSGRIVAAPARRTPGRLAQYLRTRDDAFARPSVPHTPAAARARCPPSRPVTHHVTCARCADS